MTSAANYVLTPAQRQQIAHDLEVALDEGIALADAETLTALGLVLRDGWRIDLL